LRTAKPPLLAVWGKFDPYFIPAGAEAFKKDIPTATVKFLPTGHFALETHLQEIAIAMREFLMEHQGKTVSGEASLRNARA
jgi:pimeloyl-ACP methyl ester carboxylesterase